MHMHVSSVKATVDVRSRHPLQRLHKGGCTEGNALLRVDGPNGSEGLRHSPIQFAIHVILLPPATHTTSQTCATKTEARETCACLRPGNFRTSSLLDVTMHAFSSMRWCVLRSLDNGSSMTSDPCCNCNSKQQGQQRCRRM